jgi:hypothetical protein
MPMTKKQRISGYSWLLAALYMFTGVMFFLLCRVVAGSIPARMPGLMLPTKLLLWVGPAGWLAITLSVSGLVIARQIHFRLPWISPASTIALCIGLGAIAVGTVCLATAICLQPIYCPFSNVAHE